EGIIGAKNGCCRSHPTAKFAIIRTLNFASSLLRPLDEFWTDPSVPNGLMTIPVWGDPATSRADVARDLGKRTSPAGDLRPVPRGGATPYRRIPLGFIAGAENR